MGSYEVNLEGIKVCLVIPCYKGFIPLEMGLAFVDLTVKARECGIKLEIMAERENGIITAIRNLLVSRFVDSTGADYLFWLDDDILFTAEDFIEILSWTVLKKSVAATYCNRTDNNPTFFIQHAKDDISFDKDGFIEARALGLGFACLHRSLIEELVKDKQVYKEKDGTSVYDVFKVGPVNGFYRGEDIHFFNELFSLGHTTYVHPFVNLKHVGRKDYDYKLMSPKEN